MTEKTTETRRQFLQKLATATGAVVLMPLVTACESAPEPKPADQPTSMPAKAPAAEEAAKTPAAEATMPEVPRSQPEGWDPIAYNRDRGNAGAIPASYQDDINGPDGDTKHLGKHLPYVPKVEAAMVPAGFLAIMWGDPDKGYAKHPNAPKTEDNPEGHWYDWIKVRKATDGEAEELKSEYVDWPGTDEMKGKKYAVFGGGDDLTADGGKNTIYLAALPKDVQKGDTIRIHAHCLTHGEYVDFLTVG